MNKNGFYIIKTVRVIINVKKCKICYFTFKLWIINYNAFKFTMQKLWNNKNPLCNMQNKIVFRANYYVKFVIIFHWKSYFITPENIKM